MKTVVYQSYRTSKVPRFIERCMQSVRGWSRRCEFEYRFFDDRFFDYCPSWYREKARGSILLKSDLARLVAARELLAEGFERTIWVDADLLLFDPSFRVNVDSSFAFCRELWVELKGGRMMSWGRVNNAICTFARGNRFLDFYIEACESIVRNATALNPLLVGTSLLTDLAQRGPMSLIDSVASLSPVVTQPLARGDDGPLREYIRLCGGPIRAANLGGSACNILCQGTVLRESDYDRAVDWLLAGFANGSVDQGSKNAE